MEQGSIQMKKNKGSRFYSILSIKERSIRTLTEEKFNVFV